jgi:hypothetical protein
LSTEIGVEDPEAHYRAGFLHPIYILPALSRDFTTLAALYSSIGEWPEFFSMA